MSLHALYPGEFIIFKRDRPTANWELLFRDDSRVTMDCRFAYQKETLKPGQGVQLCDPRGHVIEEFSQPVTLAAILKPE